MDAPEDGIAEAARLRLHCVHNVSAPQSGAVVMKDVSFAGRDDKAELVGAASDHALNEVLAYCPRALAAVIDPAAYWKQFLRKGQRLDPITCACRWNDSPHRFLEDGLRAGLH